MNRFKLGDEVVAIKAPDHNAQLVGEIGIVGEIDLDAALPVRVGFDNAGYLWWCEEESLELYQPDLENV